MHMWNKEKCTDITFINCAAVVPWEMPSIVQLLSLGKCHQLCSCCPLGNAINCAGRPFLVNEDVGRK